MCYTRITMVGLAEIAKGFGPLVGAVAFAFVSSYVMDRLIDRERRQADEASLTERAWLDPALRRN